MAKRSAGARGVPFRQSTGGPAFDIDGNVVGVNTMIASPTGGSIGIAFVVPADTPKSVVPQLKERGLVSRGREGKRFVLMQLKSGDTTRFVAVPPDPT